MVVKNKWYEIISQQNFLLFLFFIANLFHLKIGFTELAADNKTWLFTDQCVAVVREYHRRFPVKKVVFFLKKIFNFMFVCVAYFRSS